jgi:hypothetical protein
MAIRHMRLMLGFFFLFAGVGLVAVRFGMPEVAERISSPMRLLVGAFLAIVLAGVNFGKWYAGWLWYEQQATPVRQPLQPDPTASAPLEYNPEFDFGKQPSPNDKPANS